MTLPNFIVIGMGKAGTTSLWYYLQQHPQIYVSPQKEPHFFAADLKHEPNVVQTWEAYRALFADAAGYPAIGEISPSYLGHADPVAERIRTAIPECRIVVVLRNPIDRLWSGYWWVRAKQGFAGDFDAYAREHAAGRKAYTDLKRYYELFGAERIHAMLADDLTQAPQASIDALARFLGVAPAPIGDFSRLNASGPQRKGILYKLVWRSPPWLRRPGRWLPRRLRFRLRSRLEHAATAPRPELSQAKRQELAAFYEADTAGIEALTGLDLAHWRR